MTSISYTLTSSAGKGYATCVENFEVSCFSELSAWATSLLLHIFMALENLWPPLFLTTLDSDLFPPD